jgi:predicted acetyltransferase
MSTQQPPLAVHRIAHDGMEPMLHAIESAFGMEATPAAVASWSRILERDRTWAIKDGERVVGGGSVYSFGLSIPGGELSAGGLTAVGVLPSHRRRGALRAMIREVIDDGRARGEPLGVLWASEGPIYGRYGYGIAALRGTSIAPRHLVRFAPAVAPVGSIRLLDVAEAARLLPPVWERLAAITPGVFRRSPGWWRDEVLDDAEWRRGGAGPRFIPALEIDGEVRGYAFYRMAPEWDHTGPRNVLEVRELVAPDPDVELALWRFLFEMDLVATVKALSLPVDTPLFHRVDDPRRLALTIGDALWLRLLDLRAALEARSWATDDTLVLEVADELVPEQAGRWQLTVEGGQARVERTQAPADVTLDIGALGSLYLGGIRAADLARAGRIGVSDPATPARLDALLAVSRLPWCPAIF